MISLISSSKNAVNSTAGEVLLYGEKLIEAVYFSCSGGSSEAAVAVWGTDVPYLQAVDSPGEEDADPFCTEKRFSFAEFRSILKAAQPQTVFGIIPQDWVGTAEYTAGGGVASIYLGQCRFSGTEVRSLFSLPSTKFHLQVGNGEMIFTAYGYGHRVGMSQYGADAMAVSGSTYQQILAHYYAGTELTVYKAQNN